MCFAKHKNFKLLKSFILNRKLYNNKNILKLLYLKKVLKNKT